MNFDNEMLLLLGGIVALLCLASVITSCLIRRHNGIPTPTLENVRSRVRAWWGMVAVFAFSLLLGRDAVFGLYALLSFLALREFITLSPMPRADHRTLGWVFFAILPLHYLFAWLPWYGMFTIFIPVYAFVFIPIRSALAGDVDRFLARTSRIQWGVLTCVYFLSHLPMLLDLPIRGYEGENPKLLLFVMLVTQLSDVFQYLFGKSLGRRPIAPAVSPGKTVEGLVGGGLSAVALGTSLWWATPFTPVGAAVMSLLLVAAGFLGGLVMSAVKRSIGTKDWGHGIPGHGGVLDRLDSLLFAAPVFFHLTGFWFASDMAAASTTPDWIRGWIRGFQ